MTIPTGIVAGQCDLVAAAFCGSGFLAATLAAGKPLPQFLLSHSLHCSGDMPRTLWEKPTILTPPSKYRTLF